MQELSNAQSLALWLSEQGIDTGTWGTTGTKTVTNLWHEYEQEEITFRDDPPTRLVRVVQVVLRRENLQLYEIAQEFIDGQRRRRLQPPSEKIIVGETIAAAAERCLREELGLETGQYQILGFTSEVLERLSESPSYPGLLTHYSLYLVEATAENLPAGDFWRENQAALDGGDPVRRHLWGWR